MQTIYLDISNKGVVPIVYAKQNDVGRKFLAVLTDSGIPYTPPEGSVFSAWYDGDGGDGNYTDIGEKSAFSVNGNKVEVELILQMVSVPGEGVLCLVLNLADGSQIASWNIKYDVEQVPGLESEQAKSYYTAFSKAVENLPYPDASLTVSGKAADSAAVGQAIKNITPEQIGAAPAGSVWTATDPNNDGNIVIVGGYNGSGNTPEGGGNTGGGLTAKEVQAMIDAALAAEDELTEEEVQAMIDAALAAIPNAEEASF